MFERQIVSVDKLILNPENDRHGILTDLTPLEWMLKNKRSDIRNLAKDIVTENRLYEEPLVKPDKNKTFVVWDGNRRVTALKLLNNPDLADNENEKQYYHNLSKTYKNNIPSSISVRTEENQGVIDSYLERTHTGSQNGVGRSAWGAKESRNFLKRTNREKKISIGHEIAKKLKELGYITDINKFETTTFDRLFSNNTLRTRVGIEVRDNQIFLIADPEKTLASLTAIHTDTQKKDGLSLKKILTNSDKAKVLDSYQRQGILVSNKDYIDPAIPFSSVTTRNLSSKPSSKKDKKKRTRNPNLRTHLIPENTDIELIKGNPELNRVYHTLYELKHTLNFFNHKNAIAVLLRVVFEFSVDYYIEKKKLNVLNTELKEKAKKVADDLYAHKKIDKHKKATITKMSDHKKLISTHTLNQFVHSKDSYPSEDTLKELWDNLNFFIFSCLEN